MDIDFISREITQEKQEKFGKYFEILTEWNKVMNLTAITEPEGVALRHFADSLTLLPYIDRISVEKGGISLIDVGTGAGFPGLPLKIMRPEIKLTLLDSLDKRIKFLECVVRELGLEGVETVHARAEDAGRDGQYREKFDIAAARAVAPMSILAEYCLPFVKTGGCFIAMKGPAEENYSRALKLLGGEVVSDDLFELSSGNVRAGMFGLTGKDVCNGGNGETADDEAVDNAAADNEAVENNADEKLGRRIICIRKKSPTQPKYPRRAGLPSKSPL